MLIASVDAMRGFVLAQRRPCHLSLSHFFVLCRLNDPNTHETTRPSTDTLGLGSSQQMVQSRSERYIAGKVRGHASLMRPAKPSPGVLFVG
jgi:hypothetical protein